MINIVVGLLVLNLILTLYSVQPDIQILKCLSWDIDNNATLTVRYNNESAKVPVSRPHKYFLKYVFTFTAI